MCITGIPYFLILCRWKFQEKGNRISSGLCDRESACGLETGPAAGSHGSAMHSADIIIHFNSIAIVLIQLFPSAAAAPVASPGVCAVKVSMAGLLLAIFCIACSVRSWHTLIFLAFNRSCSNQSFVEDESRSQAAACLPSSFYNVCLRF